MDYTELKKKSDTQLKELLEEKRGELRLLRFKAHGEGLKNVHAIKQTKKSIARILTALKRPASSPNHATPDAPDVEQKHDTQHS